MLWSLEHRPQLLRLPNKRAKHRAPLDNVVVIFWADKKEQPLGEVGLREFQRGMKLLAIHRWHGDAAKNDVEVVFFAAPKGSATVALDDHPMRSKLSGHGAGSLVIIGDKKNSHPF